MREILKAISRFETRPRGDRALLACFLESAELNLRMFLTILIVLCAASFEMDEWMCSFGRGSSSSLLGRGRLRCTLCLGSKLSILLQQFNQRLPVRVTPLFQVLQSRNHIVSLCTIVTQVVTRLTSDNLDATNGVQGTKCLTCQLVEAVQVAFEIGKVECGSVSPCFVDFYCDEQFSDLQPTNENKQQ